MRGLPTLVAFRRAEAQSATIRAITDRYRRRTLQTLQIAFASSAVLELVATLSVALVAVTVGIRLAHGDLDLETALVVLLLAPEAYWPLRRVGAEFHAAAEGVATFEAAERPASTPTTRRRTGGPAPMRLDHVSVLRPGRAVPALDDVSLDVPDRGVTAVTGPSGCGKSTLLAVLAGLLEPTSGTVHGPTRDRIAWLPQRPVFVAGTVADNLRLAVPDADRRPAVGGAAPGRARGAGPRPAGRARHPARRGRRPRCPPASAPGWRWPGWCWPTGPGCCSTSRPPTSTR